MTHDKDALLREDEIERAYWRFDARRKGYSDWKGAPQSERDAFKAELRARITAALAEKDDGDALFFLDRDNDSHWYVVPEANRKEWDRWLNIPSSDAASWDIPDFAKPVGGAPNTVLFSLPPLPKGDE